MSNFKRVPMRAWPGAVSEHLARSVKRLLRPAMLARLTERNRRCQDSVVAPGGPVVSVTSYGPRVQQVFYTLETIGRGQLKPSRLILWLTHDLIEQGLPESLQRLQARGLEVLGCPDWGPHKKYFPYVMAEQEFQQPLVTADDDHLYPADWLQRLSLAYRQNPAVVHCYRAHQAVFNDDGSFRRYGQWRPCFSTEPSHRHFSTGASGVLFPPPLLQGLRQRGDAFMAVCPRADDIWLNAVAFREGFAVHQLGAWPRLFYETPDTRSHGLLKENGGQGGGNDRQLAQTYTEAERRLLQQLQPPN